jgi:hypothetical protein
MVIFSLPSVSSVAKNGSPLDNFGYVWAQFGAGMDKLGNVSASFEHTKHTLIAVFRTESNILEKNKKSRYDATRKQNAATRPIFMPVLLFFWRLT